MAEPTLTEILSAIQALDTRLGQIANAVDDARTNLAQHRRDIDVRTTQMDLSVRAEIAVVRDQVNVLTPMVEGVQVAQAAADLVTSELVTKVDNVITGQTALQSDVAVIAPKIDEVKTKQSLAEQATNELSLKIDDVNLKLTTEPVV